MADAKRQRDVAPERLYMALWEHDCYEVLRAIDSWLEQNRNDVHGFLGFLNARWGFAPPVGKDHG